MTVKAGPYSYTARGRSFDGYLADGSNGKKVPGILVAHEGRGFTQHPKDRALLLAALGYVAFAPDYLGGSATSLEHAYQLMEPFTKRPDLFQEHGLAALRVLQTHENVDAERLGAIGFCWGGFAVLELACIASLRSVVGFHPGLSLGPVSCASNLSGSVLICVGDEDPYVPISDLLEFIAQMRKASVDLQVLLLSGAPHSFTNPEPYAYATGTPNVGYNVVADRRSWVAMRNHLREAFGGTA
jgi:dienelactone hydrolase